jgi:UDP-3-O-[3-hydroxymyristoyl] glucosamine N-acyltransferase
VTLRLAEIADRIGAAIEGDGSATIHGVAGVRDAGPGEISFVALPKYAADAAATRASALIVARSWDKPLHAPILRVDNPEAAFFKVALMFAPPAVSPPPGIHPTAVIAADAKIGRDAGIGPHCVIEPGAVVGDRAVLQAGCYVGHGVTIGNDCRFYPHVSIREYCRIGDRVILHNGTVIGSDGFGYTVDKQGVRHKIPQIGIVVIGDDVEVGANVTIDRARFGKTRIGNGVKIDNLVQIAHNVIIGDHAVIVAQVGIAGSAIIGSKAVLAGQAGVAGHTVVGAGAIVGGQAAVTKDVAPGVYVSGYPAAPHKEAALLHAHVARLPELKARVAALEKRLKELESRAG